MNRIAALFPILALAHAAAVFRTNTNIKRYDYAPGPNSTRSCRTQWRPSYGRGALASPRRIGSCSLHRHQRPRSDPPPLTADRLASDPKVTHILSFDNPSSRSLADLLRRIHGATQSSPNRVVSAVMPDGDFPPSGGISQLLDSLINDFELSVVLRGGSGIQANAITVGAAGIPGMQKPDFIGSDSSRTIESALARLTQMGVSSALARKALLINAADSTAGWSADSGWGGIKPDSISALAAPDPSQSLCIDQNRSAAGVSSTCFTSAITTTQDYEIKSASPAKISAVWNRTFPATAVLTRAIWRSMSTITRTTNLPPPRPTAATCNR